jgi:hypothetical protein
MTKVDLTQYGIKGTKRERKIVEKSHNPSYEELYKAEMDPSLERVMKRVRKAS